MKHRFLTFFIALLWSTNASAMDYSNIDKYPSCGVAVADTGAICPAGTVLDPLCVNIATTLGAQNSCKCVTVGNTAAVTEYSVDLAASIDSSAVQNLSGIMANLAMNSASSVLVAEDKNGLKIQTNTFSAQGVSSGELLSRRSVLSSAISLALTKFPTNPPLRLKLFITPKQSFSGIDDTLQISQNGKKIFVQGPLVCPAGQTVRKIWVTATQESTGAFARAEWTGTCTGDTQIWHTVAKTGENSGKVFQEGSAQLCAAAVFKRRNTAQSSKQWCVDAQLIKE